MSSSTGIGKAIAESAGFVSRVGVECDGLLKLIKEELSEALLSPALRGRYKANGQWTDDCLYDEHGWLCVGAGSSLPVIVKPKRSTGGYLIAQISLMGDGIAALDNEEPLLHIGWWGSALDFDESQMSFPIEPDSGYDLRIDDKRLIRWVHTQWPEEWSFSIRLADMNTPQDVQRNVVRPVSALLLDAAASAALAGTAAVQFQQLDGKPGELRALPAL